MSAPVIFAEVPAKDRRIGRITLNSPQTLNALTLTMVDLIRDQIEAWREDEQIAVVVLDALGGRSFSAGADLRLLYWQLLEQPGKPCLEAEAFFRREYALDLALHEYPKPIICWADGITMGGGMGLLKACRYGVVTENSRLAMPEISIALFPDVGGSYFLNQLPQRLGWFLGLTGASIHATDAVKVGLVTYAVQHDQYDALWSALEQHAWSDEVEAEHAFIEAQLAALQRIGPQDSPLARHANTIASVFVDANGVSLSTGTAFVDALLNLDVDDVWFVEAQANLRRGSPLAAAWILRQLQLAEGLSLAAVYALELQLVINIIRHSEFLEGVRALMIDKDKQPKWQFTHSEEVPSLLLDQFFRPID